MKQAAKRRVAWITGAGSGIGRAVAMALASSEITVVLSARRQEAIDRVARDINEVGGQAHAYAIDVSDSEAVNGVGARLQERFGRVDVLINCAGLNIENRRLADLTPARWDDVVKVNLSGSLYPVLAVLPGMRQRGGGVIVSVSSWVGRYPAAVTGAAYAASKRGLIALSEAINAEENAHGIRSCVICPAAVSTDILDKRPSPPGADERARMLQPDDLGQLVRYIVDCPARVCINEVVLSPTQFPS